MIMSWQACEWQSEKTGWVLEFNDTDEPPHSRQNNLYQDILATGFLVLQPKAFLTGVSSPSSHCNNSMHRVKAGLTVLNVTSHNHQEKD